MVEKGIIAAQRQLETIFPLLGAMAGAGVTANPGQNRHDVPNETDLVSFLLTADLDRNDHGLARDRKRQLAVAVCYRADETAGRDTHQFGGQLHTGHAR